MIKYLGSKRVFVPTIGALFSASNAKSALDLFTGTTRVAQEFCRRGAYTIAVDTATYSEVLAQCYIETDASNVDADELQDALDHLASLKPHRGYFTEVFCEDARFLTPENGMIVDAIRDGIEDGYAKSPLRPILLTSLLLAADAVDSTVGLQMAYLKKWAPRALKKLELKAPDLLPGSGLAIRGDAVELAPTLPHVDFAYLDPPYNQHRYFTNYHVWETLVRWDKPEHYGVACKRVDAREESTKSAFNSKRTMPGALEQTLLGVNTDVLVLSFSNEGFLPLGSLLEMVQGRGEHVEILQFDHRRYVGARIGIHDTKGNKVGKVTHVRNKEYLVLAGPRQKIEEMIESTGLQEHVLGQGSGKLES